MRILFLISRLTYHGTAKQLALLARGLPPDQFERRVCVLGAAGPWADQLRAAGVVVDVLNWRWAVDLPAIGRLRHLLRAYQPDVLHVWGRSALRAVAFPGGLRRGQVFVTMPNALPTWWDRWLLRRAERITAFGQSEAERCRQAGVDADRLVIVPPGVETANAAPSDVLRPRTILCIGPLHRHKGFRDAIWVLDMLRFLHPELQLAFAGSGPDEPPLVRFAHDARVADRVHFLGDHDDVPALLAAAELVWVPSRADRGVNAALEAMTAGKPVVASRVPALAEVITDGETGLLVPPADQAALARQTRMLLEDAELCRRLGEAGRQRAAKHFSAEQMVRRYADLYMKGR